MANLCIKTPSSAIQVLIFQLLVLRPRPNVQRQRIIILYVRASLTPLWVTVASTMKTWSIISSCSRNAISSTSTLTGRKLQIQSVKDRTSNPKSIMRTIFFRVFRRRPVNAGESVQLGLLKENIQNGKHLFSREMFFKNLNI